MLGHDNAFITFNGKGDELVPAGGGEYWRLTDPDGVRYYVVDPHGNATAYCYDQEKNSYGRNLKAKDNTRYVRGGSLNRIEYGLKSSSLSGRSKTWTSLDDGAGKDWRTTSTATQFDTVAGRVTQVDDFGDSATAADDQCTRTTYATNTDVGTPCWTCRWGSFSSRSRAP
ncbi:hypothetical protein AB0B50_40015 [Streptomyces sp. NPDC041068]|uniref:hypothetical protein n=1 Tax=Streptomyces sp. NPDC041068 TaxID=3155130 RepID=UPI0033F7CA59